MRLDVFLKLSRLVPKRTVAKEFTKAGLVNVNGSVAKSSYTVKVGDEIAIKRRESVTTAQVISIPHKKQVSKKDASKLYELLAKENVDPLTD